MAGNKESGELLAKYQAGDIDELKIIFDNKLWQSTLKLGVEIANDFDISIGKIFHSPNSINEAQDRSFFEHVGLPRSEHFRFGKNSKQINEKAKAYFKQKKLKDSLEELASEYPEMLITSKNTFPSVQKVFVRYGQALNSSVTHRFPEANKLFNKKPEKGKYTDHENFFLAQYENALTNYIVTEYGIIKNLETEISNAEPGKEKSDLERKRNFHQSRFIGNFGIYPSNVDAAVEVMNESLVKYFAKEGISIVKSTGQYLYLVSKNKINHPNLITAMEIKNYQNFNTPKPKYEQLMKDFSQLVVNEEFELNSEEQKYLAMERTAMFLDSCDDKQRKFLTRKFGSEILGGYAR